MNTNPTVAMKIAGAVITAALVFFVALTLATIIAIGKSRDRSACFQAVQAVKECPGRSAWENLLIRATGL